MAIEGLSGVRGIQTQSVAAPKPVTTGKQEVPVFRTSQAAATYDKAANAVDTAVEKDNAASKTEQGQETADKEQIRKAVEKLNKNMSHSEAIFGFHEDTNRITIKIVDSTTKEVIKELPPEKTLDMIAKVWELAGMLVDEKR